MKKLISIVVPCYNEQESLPFFYKEINKIKDKLKEANFEYVFIDDGSSDDTLELIRGFAEADKKVKYISFSKNFGKEAAMYAGLEYASGDLIAIMDADLQDPPELLIEMYNYIEKEKFDMVATRRKNRKGEPVIRSFFARKFYKLINKITKEKMVDGARDFRLMTRKVRDAVLSFKEYNRYSKGLFSIVGFKTKWIDYENVKRVAGKTKWSFWKLFKYAIDAIISFSATPLVLSAIIGLLFFIIAFVMIVVIVVKTLMFGDPVDGWPSLVCIIFLVSGVQLFCIGIIGSYLSKTYMETKNRPLYLIKETDKDK